MATHAGLLVSRLAFLAACFSTLSCFAIAENGFASYYTDTIPSACFENDLSQFPPDGFWAAVNDPIFQDKKACGQRYTVKCTGMTNQTPGAACTGNTITVKVIDRCPFRCGFALRGFSADFDLSQAAFEAVVSTKDAGVVKIEYNLVE